MSKKEHLPWNDFLFNNRNKAYGAYQIRTNEGWNLLKSLLLCLSIVGITALIFSFTTKDAVVTPQKADKPLKEHVFVIVDEKPDLPKFVAPKVIPSSAPKSTEEKSKQTPDPKDAPLIETPIQNNVDLDLADATDENAGVDGERNSHSTQTSSSSGTAVDGPTTVLAPETTRTTYNAREVTKMAVFPGCESSANDKVSLQKCMAKQLQSELGNQLQHFEEVAQKYHINTAKTQLQFVVDKNGRITHIKTLNGNHVKFDQEAQAALDRIAKKMVQRKQFIQAAELDDGSKINLIFTIPLHFILQQ